MVGSEGGLTYPPSFVILRSNGEAARRQIMANIRTSRKSGFILRSGVRRRETIWFADAATAFTTIVAANTAVLVSSLNAAII